jgi:tRNA (guanine37-N1)-methyltransferase
MVLKPEPILNAINFAFKGARKSEKKRTILFSLRGRRFTQKDAKRLSKYNHLVFVCGRYEGVDERIAKNIVDEEISIGDFVLSGGELPALTVSEALLRHIPGVLGKQESLEELKGSYPVYTRPPVFVISKGGKKKKLSVPPALLSGNHSEIEKWRKERQTKSALETGQKKSRG